MSVNQNVEAFVNPLSLVHPLLALAPRRRAALR